MNRFQSFLLLAFMAIVTSQIVTGLVQFGTSSDTAADPKVGAPSNNRVIPLL